MADHAVEAVRRLEGLAIQQPQVPIRTAHVIHGGMYARTIFLPAGVMITGALIKIATLLVVQGEALVYVGGDEPLRLAGHNVLPASAGRKQVIVALADLSITMVFPTAATTVEEAERQFTDEVNLLASHRDNLNHVTITGE
jgi:hypothetical protein